MPRAGWSSSVGDLARTLRSDAPIPARAVDALLAELCAEPPPGVWHPTGFVVLALDEHASGTLRLHVWPAGTREHGRPCWPVHDHAWHLRSQVLCGEVLTQGYRIASQDGGEHRLYAVDYARGRQSQMLKSSRRVEVQREPPQRVCEGERYEVAAGAFHSSGVTTGQLAATLVVTTATERSHPWVIGPEDGPPTVAVDRPQADPERVRTLLRAVQKARARGSASCSCSSS